MSSTLRTLGAFLGGLLAALTFLFGSGVYWQYRESILKTDEAKHALRDKQLDTLQKIIEYSSKHTEAQKSFQKTGDYKSQNKAMNIEAYLESLKENYRELEKYLVQLENRPIKEINLDFLPSPPPVQLEVGEK